MDPGWLYALQYFPPLEASWLSLGQTHGKLWPGVFLPGGPGV